MKIQLYLLIYIISFLTACTESSSSVPSGTEQPTTTGEIKPDSKDSKETEVTDVPIPKPPIDTVESDDDFSSFFLAPEKRTSRRIDDDFVPFSQDSDEAILDLQTVKREDEDKVAFTRYISLSYLDFDEFKEFEDPDFAKEKTRLMNSLSVLLNSLSTDEQIAKIVPINDQMSLFRLDISDLGWTTEQWERLISADPNDPRKKAYPYNNTFDQNIESLQEDLDTEVPIIRGDWLVFEGGKPQPYYDLLDIKENFFDTEIDDLGVNRLDNIQRTIDDPDSPRTIRAAIGASNSGVSLNNRIVERHDSNQGAFWISYDFLAVENVDERNIFSSPLGPASIGNIGGLKGFIPAGGEAFFNLENGLQGYALLDGENRLVDEAPLEVVRNKEDDRREGVIENGYVCWSCHSQGVLRADDEMKDFIDNLSDRDIDDLYNDDALDALQAMHLDRKTFDKQVKEDSKIHTRAVKEAQLLGTYNIFNISLIGYKYEQELSFEALASELNITPAQLDQVRDQIDDNDLRQAINTAKNSQLARENFEAIFPDLIQEIFDLEID